MINSGYKLIFSGDITYIFRGKNDIFWGSLILFGEKTINLGDE